MGVRCDKTLIRHKSIGDPGPKAVMVGSLAWWRPSGEAVTRILPRLLDPRVQHRLAGITLGAVCLVFNVRRDCYHESRHRHGFNYKECC